MMLCGGLAAHLYGAVMTVLAVSVLTNKIFNDSSMPWMTLWRSTFITSFLNSFEILGICAFFILNAVKAGIAVKTALDIFNTKYAVFVLLGIFAVSVLLTLFSGIFYAAAVLSVIFGLLAPAFSLLIKYREKIGPDKCQNRFLMYILLIFKAFPIQADRNHRPCVCIQRRLCRFLHPKT